ncbi:hypothetical protein JXD38_12010 [candidate division WOR-3 bacterium]|nr:hypothetical protein [candidate division WOR-3 bacterium]
MAPAPAAGSQRTKQLRTITCLAGIGAAGVGIAYVLTGNARAVDIVLIVGGLLALLAGLVLIRTPRGR